MGDAQLYSSESAMAKATVTKTTLALSKMRLVKGPFAPTRHMTKVELLALEADFDGYPAGGYALTAWTGPIRDPNGGAIITSPLVNPAYGPADEPPVGNAVGGWWIETAAGLVWLIGRYEDDRPMNVVGDGFAWVVQIVEARNPDVV